MKKSLFLAIMLASIIAGCVRFDEAVPDHATDVADASTQTRSGASAPTYTVLPDPYALENVQAVYDSFGVDIELQPTHLYVRFRPQNSEQLERLESEYELDLYEYPLDIEIPEGEEYVDPTIPESELGWYYIGVPIDFAFPQDIEYEIIRECYIPEEDEVVPPPVRIPEVVQVRLV